MATSTFELWIIEFLSIVLPAPTLWYHSCESRGNAIHSCEHQHVKSSLVVTVRETTCCMNVMHVRR